MVDQDKQAGMALVEISVMEQRYDAVMAVLQEGWKVTKVAARLGVTRQTVRNWVIRYKKECCRTGH